MPITSTTRAGTIRNQMPTTPPRAVGNPSPVFRQRPVQENRNSLQTAGQLERKSAQGRLKMVSGPKPQRFTPQASMSSYAAGKLRWNSINGSGPVSNRGFVRAHANDNPQSFDWVFRTPGNK